MPKSHHNEIHHSRDTYGLSGESLISICERGIILNQTGVVTKISQRVIRKPRKLEYLELALDAPVATGYDPLVAAEPELARTLSASVQQRIAFGDWTGQRVRRIGSGVGDRLRDPTLSGPCCARVNGFSLHYDIEAKISWTGLEFLMVCGWFRDVLMMIR